MVPGRSGRPQTAPPSRPAPPSRLREAGSSPGCHSLNAPARPKPTTAAHRHPLATAAGQRCQARGPPNCRVRAREAAPRRSCGGPTGRRHRRRATGSTPTAGPPHKHREAPDALARSANPPATKDRDHQGPRPRGRACLGAENRAGAAERDRAATTPRRRPARQPAKRTTPARHPAAKSSVGRNRTCRAKTAERAELRAPFRRDGPLFLPSATGKN
jgi:hypothetical protein